jgi:proline dehydrogenase
VFAAIESGRLDSNVSVKPTALGLDLSYDLCRENLESVLHEAAKSGNFVRIDMEDSSTTSDTLRLYRELRERGFDNVGVVLQAYLRRSLDDVRALADLEPNVRLCKGIYIEPPSIAFTDNEAVRANYVRCLDALLDAGAYVGVATHDEWLIGQALTRLQRLQPSEYEFQMLLGVREQRASELVAAGHRLRVYVPFGEHWYQYSLRRLQENPAMAGTIARATVGRVLGRSS